MGSQRVGILIPEGVPVVAYSTGTKRVQRIDQSAVFTPNRRHCNQLPIKKFDSVVFPKNSGFAQSMVLLDGKSIGREHLHICTHNNSGVAARTRETRKSRNERG